MLNGSTVGITWELLSLLRDARGLSVERVVRCQSNTRHCKLSTPHVINLVSRLVVHVMPGGAARWRLHRFVFINQHNSHVEPWTKKSPELEYIYPFFPHTSPFSYPPVLYTPTASWSRYHVACTIQRLSFQHTPVKLHSLLRSVCTSFH